MHRHPKLYFTYFPKVMFNLAEYKSGKIQNHLMQRKLFSFLTMVDDFDVQIEKFWNRYEKKISAWYLAQKKPDDLIISASPTCIIEPIAKRLGVQFMASEYDREYGVFLDNLMYAKEKAKYITDHGFPIIENFYSDSLADTPLALLADHAHLVTKRATTVVDWPDLNDPKIMEKIQKKVDTGWEIHLKEKTIKVKDRARMDRENQRKEDN